LRYHNGGGEPFFNAESQSRRAFLFFHFEPFQKLREGDIGRLMAGKTNKNLCAVVALQLCVKKSPPPHGE
jgi:hypothetical protein